MLIVASNCQLTLAMRHQESLRMICYGTTLLDQFKTLLGQIP